MGLPDGATIWLRERELDTGRAGAPGSSAALEAADGALRLVGRASFARVYGPRASLTMSVEEDYWHKGLPELLLRRLCLTADCRGIARFVASVPASDLRMLALLRVAFAAEQTRDGARVDAEFTTRVPAG